MSTSSDDATLIVDLGSIFEVLATWRAHGDVRDAREIAQTFVEQPDLWISQLGRIGRDRFPSDLHTHRGFPDRRVLVPRGWGATEAARDLQRRVSVKRIDWLDALDELERLGFVVSESKSSGGLHLASEIIGMAASGGMPSVLLLATGDPSVEPILRTARASGVRTGLVFFGTKRESREIEQIPDRFIDMFEVVIKAFGLSLEPGFRVLEPVRHHLRDLVATVLRRSASFSFISFEELWDELFVVDTDDAAYAIDEIPRHPNGLRVLLEEWFATRSKAAFGGNDDEDDLAQVLGDWVQVPHGLVLGSLIERLAKEVLARIEGAPKPLALLGSPVQEAIARHEPKYSHPSAYLGHDKLIDLLVVMDRYAREHAPSWPGWDRIAENGTDYLVRRGDDLPSLADAPHPPGLERVAQLVTDALVVRGGELSLADLALRVAADRSIRCSKANQWGGYKTFVNLLRAAQASSPGHDSQWEYVNVAPGSLRLIGTAADASASDAPDADVTFVRRSVPDFPSEDSATLRLRAAVLASILGPMPTVGMYYRHQSGLVIDARDRANDLKIASGRVGYGFLLKSMRLIDGHKAPSFQANVRRSADLLLARAGLPAVAEVAPDPDRSPVPAAVVLLEIVHDSIEDYVSDRPEQDRERIIRVVRTKLLPEETGPLLPTDEELVEKVVRALRRDNGASHAARGEVASQARDMLVALRDDRRRFGTDDDPTGTDHRAAGREAASSVQAYLEQAHADSGGSGMLDEVYEGYSEWVSSRGESTIGFAAFTVAVAELAREGRIEQARFDWLTVPGWLPTGGAEDERLRAWREVHHALRRVSNQYLAQGAPVSWVDVAAALVRRA